MRPRRSTSFVLAGASLTLALVLALEGALRTMGGVLGGGLRKRFTEELGRVVRAHGSSESVDVLSDDMSLLFPAVNELDLAWRSPFPSLWVLPLVYADGCASAVAKGGRIAQAEAWMRDELWRTEFTSPPAIILDDRRVDDLPHASSCRSVSEFLAARDGRFARLLADYVPVDSIGDYVVLSRRDERD